MAIANPPAISLKQKGIVPDLVVHVICSLLWNHNNYEQEIFKSAIIDNLMVVDVCGETVSEDRHKEKVICKMKQNIQFENILVK